MFCVDSLHLNLTNLVKFILPLRVEVLFMLLKPFSLTALKKAKQKEKFTTTTTTTLNNMYTV